MVNFKWFAWALLYSLITYQIFFLCPLDYLALDVSIEVGCFEGWRLVGILYVWQLLVMGGELRREDVDFIGVSKHEQF